MSQLKKNIMPITSKPEVINEAKSSDIVYERISYNKTPDENRVLQRNSSILCQEKKEKNENEILIDD